MVRTASTGSRRKREVADGAADVTSGSHHAPPTVARSPGLLASDKTYLALSRGGMTHPRHRSLKDPRSHQSIAGSSRMYRAATSTLPRLQYFQSSFAAREYWNSTRSISNGSRSSARN